MKLSLIVICLLAITGCAVGTGPEPEPQEPEVEVYQKVPTPKPPAPPPVEEEDNSHCKVYSYWINNCLVTKVYCDGQLKDMDVKCKNPRPLFPWEYIPDPAPYEANHVGRRESN
jgi:hypothetical protein